MATTSAIQTFQHNTLREDLSDVVTMVSPSETPFLSSFGRTKATNVLHEWSKDSLAAPADNAHKQGDEFSFTRKNTPVRKNNYTQIIINDYEVSETVRAANPAGYSDEFGRQKMKATKSHALDIERALVQGVKNAGATGTATKMDGVLTFITTNTETATTAHSIEDREAKLNELFKKIWNESGATGDYTIYVSGNDVQQISRFRGVATEITSLADKQQVTSSVEVFKTAFGVFRLKLHRWLPAGTLAVINHDYWKTAWLRPTTSPDVAKIGDSERGVIVSELTLEARAEEANGKMTGLETAPKTGA